ncbi:MAG: CxxxxCH/CxxCH domain-containing protein, partial [Myxococcota bacterium]
AVIEADNATFVSSGALHMDGVVEATHHHPAGWTDPAQHGAAFNASDVNATDVDACTTCHGPALDGGIAGTSCNSCHAAYSSNWQVDCVFCHGGTDNQTGAPPAAVDGTTTRSDVRVGAHSKHVVAGAIQAARDCTTCHAKPVNVFSAGHIDGTADAEVAATSINGISPFGTTDATYATGACGDVYCHGNGRGNNGFPLGVSDWTSTTAMTCTSCHPYSTSTEAEVLTMSGEHRRHVLNNAGTAPRYACNRCHATVASSTGTIIDVALHVNGSRNVSFSATGTWDPNATDGGARHFSCDPSCHGLEYWYGN